MENCEMNSEEAMEALAESVGLIRPQVNTVDNATALQGANALPPQQGTEQNHSRSAYG